jgi:hypothetical protein
MSALEKSANFTGKVAYDLLHKAFETEEMQNVEETLDAMTPAYFAELEDCAKKNSHKYQGNFYIVCLRKKENFFVNVLRQWFIARQTKPLAAVMLRDYPNHDHDIWEIGRSGELKLLWTLPPGQEQQTILKNKHLYHSDLVKWIEDYHNGFLE